MIGTVLLGLVWATIFGTYYTIFRYRGDASLMRWWYLAGGVAWAAYGVSTMDYGWHWAWNYCWSFLVGFQLTNAVIAAGKAGRDKEESKW